MTDSSPYSRDEALEALNTLDPGIDRDTWVRILAAAKAADLSLEEVTAWSSRGGNYKGPKDVSDNWKHLKAAGGVSAGTLFFLASESGWTRSAPLRAGVRVQRPSRSKRSGSDADEGERFKVEQMRRAMSDIVAGALVASDDHPYLTRKRITSEGLLCADRDAVARTLGYVPKVDEKPLSGDTLIVVPYTDVAGALLSIEFIDEEGRKASIFKLPRKEAMWASGPITHARRIGICEGMATAKTLQATNTCEVMLAAGSIANLANVANAVRHARPTAEIIIFGELGKAADVARTVAESVFGTVVLPEAASMPAGGTDFNDMAEIVGLEGVATYIEPRLIHPRRVSFANARTWIDIDYVLPGLEPGSVGMIVGPGGVGKTYLCMQIAASIAAGRSVLGNDTLLVSGPPAKTLLLLGEDSRNQLSNRLFSIRKAFRVTEHEDELLDANMELYSLQGYDMLLLRQERHTLAETSFIARLKQLCTGKRIAFIDPLVRLNESDENDNTAASRLMLIITSIADETGCAIVLLHHSPKSDRSGVRGASALTTSARWILNVVSPTEDDCKKLSIPEDEASKWIKCQGTKMNYGGVEPASWYRRVEGGALKAADPEAKDFERTADSRPSERPSAPTASPGQKALPSWARKKVVQRAE